MLNKTINRWSFFEDDFVTFNFVELFEPLSSHEMHTVLWLRASLLLKSSEDFGVTPRTFANKTMTATQGVVKDIVSFEDWIQKTGAERMS